LKINFHFSAGGILMKQVVRICLIMLAFGMVINQDLFAEPFTPGNIVLVDALEDRLIEVELAADFQARVVQVVTWSLGDTSRRRPLGIDFDPLGNAYVGITGVPVGATQAEFPEGRGELMRISPDGEQNFYVLPPQVTKGVWVSSFNPNEVFVMNNEPPPPFPSQSYRMRFTGDEWSDTTLFNVTSTPQGNGNGGNGKALILPDGRILIPSSTDNFINIYDENGGDPIDQIPTEKGYRSLAYIEGTDYLLANPNSGTSIDRIGFDGAIQGTFDFTIDNLNGVFNFTTLNDGTERFIATNHNGNQASKSRIYIYDASDLESIIPDIYDIIGLQDFGDEDGLAIQLFDSAVVPVPTSVVSWELY
jgi:hypothetical protein